MKIEDLKSYQAGEKTSFEIKFENTVYNFKLKKHYEPKQQKTRSKILGAMLLLERKLTGESGETLKIKGGFTNAKIHHELEEIARVFNFIFEREEEINLYEEISKVIGITDEMDLSKAEESVEKSINHLSCALEFIIPEYEVVVEKSLAENTVIEGVINNEYRIDKGLPASPDKIENVQEVKNDDKELAYTRSPI